MKQKPPPMEPRTMQCALCRMEPKTGGLAPIFGLDFCSSCLAADPAEKLAPLDIAVEWDTRLMRFSAGLGIAGQPPELYLKCAPELWYHKVLSPVIKDFEVGDAAFDDQIRIRTSEDDLARDVLASDGVRSAILALLSNVRVNELVGSHVTLEGPTLLISARPLGGLPPEKIQQMKVQAAALALHLRFRDVAP